MSRTAASLLLLLLIGVCWGSLFPFMKLAASAGVPRFAFGFWALVGVAAVLLLDALRRTPKTGQLLPLQARPLRFYTVIAICRALIPVSVSMWLADRVPASAMALAMLTAPLLTCLFTFLINRRQLAAISILGLLCGFAGSAVLLLSKSGLAALAVSTGWLLLSFIPPAAFALTNALAIRLRPPHLDDHQAAAGASLAGAILLGLVMAASQQISLPPLDGPGGLALLLYIIAESAAVIAFFTLLRWRGATFTGQSNYISATVGVAFGLLLFNETMPPVAWVSLLLVLTGLFLVNRGQAPR
jgi:drug/metabolite transporter (DMT)-like permease